jgi:hypothetical protein
MDLFGGKMKYLEDKLFENIRPTMVLKTLKPIKTNHIQ